jgi:hypothetical protein
LLNQKTGRTTYINDGILHLLWRLASLLGFRPSSDDSRVTKMNVKIPTAYVKTDQTGVC